MTRPNDKEKVRDHYDRVSPYYYSLWGQHLHHGYWVSGHESKDAAQLQLVEHLADVARLARGQKILDVGCGFGASSIHLAQKYEAETTGITISRLQVEMADKAATAAGVKASFLLMDAEAMHFEESFDVVWCVESISHYLDIPNFFSSAAGVLRPGGTLAITDWFKRNDVTAREFKKFFHPIEQGMLVELHTMENYKQWMAAGGLQVVRDEILNKNCAKTWDLCLDIIKDKSLWALAAQNGAQFVRFLRAFKAMRSGYASGNFIYGLMVAQKPA